MEEEPEQRPRLKRLDDDDNEYRPPPQKHHLKPRRPVVEQVVTGGKSEEIKTQKCEVKAGADATESNQVTTMQIRPQKESGNSSPRIQEAYKQNENTIKDSHNVGSLVKIKNTTDEPVEKSTEQKETSSNSSNKSENKNIDKVTDSPETKTSKRPSCENLEEAPLEKSPRLIGPSIPAELQYLRAGQQVRYLPAVIFFQVLLSFPGLAQFSRVACSGSHGTVAVFLK